MGVFAHLARFAVLGQVAAHTDAVATCVIMKFHPAGIRPFLFFVSTHPHVEEFSGCSWEELAQLSGETFAKLFTAYCHSIMRVIAEAKLKQTDREHNEREHKRRERERAP